MAKRWQYFPIIVLLCVVIAFLIYVRYSEYMKALAKKRKLAAKKPAIVSAHCINMDSSTDRWKETQEYASKANLSLVRWPAVNGQEITEDDLFSLRVSKIIYRHGLLKNQRGVIGCFLSHRGLLNHLRMQSFSKNDCHLILEDDVYIPPDFYEQWNSILRDVPNNWDIIQIGVTFPNLKPLKGRVHTHLHNRGNVGAFAYVVRHGALPKITEHLEYMYDPIDIMIRNKWKEWNIYIVWPQICRANDHGKSTIVLK